MLPEEKINHEYNITMSIVSYNIDLNGNVFHAVKPA